MLTGGGVVFDAQVDMFLNTEAEVSSVWEIFLFKFIFFHF